MRIQVEVLNPQTHVVPEELLDGLRACTQVGRVLERQATSDPRARGSQSSQGAAGSGIELLYLPAGSERGASEPAGAPEFDIAAPDPRALIVASEDPRFALRAFHLGAADFLHLPADTERIAQAVDRAADRLVDLSGRLGGLLQGLLETVGRDEEVASSSLVCNSGDKVIFIPLDDVRWIESMRNTARIHTSENTYCKRISLSQLEERLPSHFWRLHRSAIVNTHRLSRIESTRSATSHAILDDGTRVAVSRRHRLRQINPLLA